MNRDTFSFKRHCGFSPVSAIYSIRIHRLNSYTVSMTCGRATIVTFPTTGSKCRGLIKRYLFSAKQNAKSSACCAKQVREQKGHSKKQPSNCPSIYLLLASTPDSGAETKAFRGPRSPFTCYRCTSPLQVFFFLSGAAGPIREAGEISRVFN